MGSSALGDDGSLDPLPKWESLKRRGKYRHTAPQTRLLQDDFLLSTVQIFVANILLMEKRLDQFLDPLQKKHSMESAGSWFRIMVV